MQDLTCGKVEVGLAIIGKALVEAGAEAATGVARDAIGSLTVRRAETARMKSKNGTTAEAAAVGAVIMRRKLNGSATKKKRRVNVAAETVTRGAVVQVVVVAVAAAGVGVIAGTGVAIRPRVLFAMTQTQN